MATSIRYGPLLGEIEICSGVFLIHIEDEELKKNITEILEQPYTQLKPFRHKGIPGAIKVQQMVKTNEDIVAALLSHEEELGIWVETPDRDVHDNPLFGLGSFTLLKWNQSDIYPWFVVEHNLTGYQAFYHGQLKGKESVFYHWFKTPITQSGLVDNWVDFEEKFSSLEEIPYW